VRLHSAFIRETFSQPAVILPRKFVARVFSSLVLITVASIAGLATPLGLAAQRASADDSGTADRVAASASDPADTADEQPAGQAAGTAIAQSAAAQAQPSGASASAPQNQPSANASAGSGDKQTKRILGIVPNFRAVSADEKLPPETVKEKFVDATEDSFDYSSIFIPAVIAGYDMARDATPEFHQGGAGFARYFWHSAVDQTSENYMVEFIFPTVTHEDARYYTLGHGGFMKRAGYALSRAVITRADSGKSSFNFSEVVGAGCAAGLSNLYYPSATRSLGSTASQWGLDVGIDAGAFVFREFWPDINHRVFHNHYSNAPAQP
jgi:hypothetical protein